MLVYKYACVCVGLRWLSVLNMIVCVQQMQSPLLLSESLFFAAQTAKASAREQSAGGENKVWKTLGMVNVKQIIKYGKKTTEKEPTVLRQHMLIRYGLVH